MIIAFEGVDGAGKNTLVNAVEQELISREVAVARLAFPRYEHSITAQLALEALYQRMGDLNESIYGMATMFALDRHEVGDDLAELDDDGYVILLDRYSASNAAYSAARMSQREGEHPDNFATHEIVDWVDRLEFTSLGLPVPDLQVLVDVNADIARQRASDRAADDESRAKDVYERDDQLQQNTVQAYRDLAAAQWRSPWLTVDFSGNDVKNCAEGIADAVEETLKEAF